MTKRYKRIAPNEIGVIYGKRRSVMTGADGVKQEVGFKLVTGGAVFVWPIVEQYALMSTEAFQIEISEDNIPSAKNVGGDGLRCGNLPHLTGPGRTNERCPELSGQGP